MTSNPAGIDCAPTCSATVDAGTAVTLTATPAANQSFEGWGGACASVGTVIDAGTGVASTNDICAPCTQNSDCVDGSGSGLTLVCTGGYCQTTSHGDCNKSDCSTVTRSRGCETGGGVGCRCAAQPLTNDVCGACNSDADCADPYLSLACIGGICQTLSAAECAVSTCGNSGFCGCGTTCTCGASSGTCSSGTCDLTLSSDASATATFSEVRVVTANYQCTSAVGGAALTVVIAGDSPLSTTPGSDVSLASYQAFASLPASLVNDAVGLGCTTVTVSVTELDVDSNDATGKTINAAATPLDSTVNLFQNTPAVLPLPPSPTTLGPWTAPASGTLNLTSGDIVVDVNGCVFPITLTCTPSPAVTISSTSVP